MALGDITSYVVNELLLITKTHSVDIRSIMEELNIYDNLFLPAMSGNVVLVDTMGLSQRLKFDGTEYLKVDIGKTEDDILFQKTFRIYKQGKRQNLNNTTEVYVLSFCSEEILYSEQKKINQAYEDTYSNVAHKIIIDHLKVSEENLSSGFHDESYGIRSFTLPNMKPIQAINWCAKRALDIYDAPSFLFFENRDGFNLCSLYTLIEQDPICTITFGVKDKGGDGTDFFGARESRIIKNFDASEMIKSGLMAGTFKGFDPVTRSYYNNAVNFATMYADRPHLNEYPFVAFLKNRDGNTQAEEVASKQSISVMDSNYESSSYAQAKDPYAQTDNPEMYEMQRQSIFYNLMSKRISVTMPGNFMFTSGRVVELEYPSYSQKSDSESHIDEGNSGKYLITGVRHVFRFTMHETVIEVATDSTNSPPVINGSENQSEAIYE